MTIFVSRFKHLHSFSGPKTVLKSLLCSKSEELTESFKFIQFVVGTRVDPVLYKMLMYSCIFISSLRKDMWLKRRRKRKDVAVLALVYTLTYLFVNLSS